MFYGFTESAGHKPVPTKAVCVCVYVEVGMGYGVCVTLTPLISVGTRGHVASGLCSDTVCPASRALLHVPQWHSGQGHYVS